ncbi:helix-turn-helix domain-containing protein [Streptomyces sp. NPDC056909]|uniref:helix-turn-helix domain-containing protein n=1 Tax=Streptomyces sp. NPDC056909 TaxID=3345963 RepID=UPI0036768294
MSAAEPHRVAYLEPYLSRPDPAPTLLKMLVGAQLAGMRKDAGMTQQDVGRHLRCSASKLCRIETGRSRKPASESTVVALLSLYGADDYERSVLLQLLRRSSEPGWWQRYDNRLMPEWSERLIGLQEATAAIRTFEVHFVPGLLQTPAYARAVTRRGLPMASQAEVERRTELRMRRQALLSRPDAPRLWAVIDEAVLHRVLGSREVMREQLEHLVEKSHWPNVTLQVVPLDLTDASSPGMPITYLRFPARDLPDIVYLEQIKSAIFLEEPEETQEYRLVLDRLADESLNPKDTRELLRRTLRERYP